MKQRLKRLMVSKILEIGALKVDRRPPETWVEEIEGHIRHGEKIKETVF